MKQCEDEITVKNQLNIQNKIVTNLFFKWNIKDEILCWNNKWYVSFDLLKRKLFKQNHDDSYIEHFEHKWILKLLKKKYFWTNLFKDVKQYVHNYLIYHWIKSIWHKSHNFLQLFSQSKDSRQKWIMNFITNLFSSKHQDKIYDVILIMINRYNKYTKNVLTKKTSMIKNLKNALIDEIFTKYDKFVFFTIDQDSLFIFNFWSILCYHLWIQLHYNIIYHSQTNKQAKRQN